MSHYRNGPVAPGIAFVTGGARGLGNAVAVSFAKEGARGVALVDILDDDTMNEGKALVEKFGAKCITIHADVTKEDDVERAVQQCVAEFGRIDYAVNFAGIAGPAVPIVDTDLELYRRVLEVNTIGVWLCCKHELRQMMKQDSVEVEEGRVAQRGSIVNAASLNSLLSAAETSGYTSAKHAVPGLTKTAALEGREHNIRVNCVSPGFLATQLGESITSGNLTDNILVRGWPGFVARQGRTATADEIGDVVVLLSTPRMSLVNGHNLVIDKYVVTAVIPLQN